MDFGGFNLQSRLELLLLEAVDQPKTSIERRIPEIPESSNEAAKENLHMHKHSHLPMLPKPIGIMFLYKVDNNGNKTCMETEE
jgi:hypothetical protein